MAESSPHTGIGDAMIIAELRAGTILVGGHRVSLFQAMDDDNEPPAAKRIKVTEDLLAPFETYGWKPETSLSVDENWMDLTMLITRSSQLQGGSMACLLVGEENGLLAAATNRALYSKKDSDVHAEVCAVGQAAQAGHATRGCTAYITMPPCKRCLGLLVAAGVKRVVSRILPKDPPIVQAAKTVGLELAATGNLKEQYARIEGLLEKHKRL